MLLSHYFDSCSFFRQCRMPLILVMIGSLLLGMVIQYLLGLTKHLSLKGEIKSLKKE
ncbi:TPA: lipopolysaccharide assembly protein LapA domain-containing protein [Streptococcus suis]